MKKNKHGLPRYIPTPVRQNIRKQCGFGCVVCGFGITQYEHIDPEYKDAHEHDPLKMALLCGSCHDKVTRKIWSKVKIKKALASPKCLDNGYTSDIFDIGESIPSVEIGDSIWIDTPIIVQVQRVNILELKRSTENTGSIELSALFCNDQDEEVFRINKNIWQGDIRNWDIETVGQTITIRKSHKEVALKITINPKGMIIIDKINMTFKKSRIIGEKNKGFYVEAPDGSRIALQSSRSESCDCGVQILEDRVAFGLKCKSITS